MASVLHTALRYPPAKGGVESYIADIAALADIGHHQVLASDLADHLSWRRLNRDQLAGRPDGVETLPAVKLRLMRGYPWLQGLPARVRAASAQVVHGHALYYASLDVALHTAGNRALVVNLYAHRRPGWRQRPYLMHVDRALRRVDRLVHISDFERRLAHDLLPITRRLPDAVIPPAIRFIEPVEADPDLVVAVGRHDVGKGSEDLPVIAELLRTQRPGSRVVVIGGRSSHTAWLQARAAESEGHLLVLPDADDETLVSTVRRASAFVTPTRYEAFGIAAVEAAAAGVPVIAYDHSALPTVLGPDELTSAAPFDATGLSRALMDVLDRAETLSDRRSRAASMRLRFGPEQWKAGWQSVYGEVL